MGQSWSGDEAPSPEGTPELTLFVGLGDYIAQDKKAAPIFLLQGESEKAANVAIAGSSGVGKSLLVNTVRGVKPGDPTWAPVGVTETTREPVWYEFQEGSSVRLWDMEGAGSSWCSWKNYTGNVGLRHFDAVLLLSAARLTETDVEIIAEMERESVPLFLVRTKLDEDVRNNQVDLGMSPAETEESIRKDLQGEGIQDVYLINARKPQDHDFPKLLEDLASRLDFFDGPPKDTPEAASGSKGVVEEEEEKEGSAKKKIQDSLPEGVVIPGLDQVPEDIVASWTDIEAKTGLEAAEKSWRLFKAPAGAITEGKFDFEKGEIEPLDNLCGHWVYCADDNMYEYFENEMGSILAYGMVKLSGPPEHTYWKEDDGVWGCIMKNYWTNLVSPFVKPEAFKVMIDPKDETSALQLMMVGNKKFTGQTRDWIENNMLCSEQHGKAMKFDGKRKKERFHYKMSRYVAGGRYWVTIENLINGNQGSRIFNRHPYYRINNKTDKVVSLKTWAVGASFWRSATSTREIKPGEQFVDTPGLESTAEQAVFTLPNRKQFTISQVNHYGSYTLENKDFR